MNISRTLALIKKEFISIWMDPKTRFVIFAVPIFQLIIFSNAVTMEVTNIDMTILDKCNSVESRELISKFEHSKRFRKFYYVDNEEKFKKNIDTQKSLLGLYIKNDFSKSIKSGRITNVEIISDGRQTNTAAIATNYANQIVSNFNDDVCGFKSSNFLNIVMRNWYNPNLEYKWFILTVILALISLTMVLILTAVSIARERELGTFDQLIVSPLSSFEILVGKSVPPLILSVIVTLFMTLIVLFFFNIPFKGSILLFLLSVIIASLSIIGVGIFISSVCKTQQQAALGIITFMMPAILLSGYISPIEDMPVFLQYLTYLDPARFFIVLTRGIFLKGIGFSEAFVNFIPLLCIASITLTLAERTFKRNLE